MLISSSMLLVAGAVLFSAWHLKSDRSVVRLVAGTILALIAASLVLALIYRNEINELFEVDRCLDAGGRWNHDSGTCEPESR